MLSGWGFFGEIKLLLLSEGKDFHHQEGDRNAQDSCQQVADYRRECQHVVEDDDDDILDEVVGDVGNEEFDIARQGQAFVKDEAAVHPVGDKVACDVADVEVQVVVGAEKAAQPGDKGAVEGVDAAYYQEQEKFLGEKVMLCFFNDVHG